jgi:hypothetical protein
MRTAIFISAACLLLSGCQYMGFRETDWKLSGFGCSVEAHTKADGSYLGESCKQCPHCIKKAAEEAAKKSATK